MKSLIPALALLATGLSASAQTVITLTQSNFPAGPTNNLYYRANLSGVTRPTTGANQTWDYRSLTSTAPVVDVFTAPPAASPFPTATRSAPYAVSLGALVVRGTTYQALTSTGLQDLGSQLPLQRFGLGTLTGNPTDSLVVPAQTVSLNNRVLVRFPLTAGTVTRHDSRTGTVGLLTVGIAGLNRTPLRLVQRVSRVDSVAGWGTVRIPASTGATAAIPVLMQRTRIAEVDSFYLGGQPAPAVLLAALGVQQGATTGVYYDSFFRANSGQAVLEFDYTSATFQTLSAAYYSREANLPLTVRPALAPALGGLSAFPNPVGQGPLTLAAGNGSREPLRLTVRDVLGRALTTAAATTGQPTGVLDGLPAGTYLLEAEGANGARSTLRVVRE
jgi:hypothetical protein